MTEKLWIFAYGKNEQELSRNLPLSIEVPTQEVGKLLSEEVLLVSGPERSCVAATYALCCERINRIEIQLGLTSSGQILAVSDAAEEFFLQRRSTALCFQRLPLPTVFDHAGVLDFARHLPRQGGLPGLFQGR